VILPLKQAISVREIGNGLGIQTVRSVFDIRIDLARRSEMLASGMTFFREDTISVSLLQQPSEEGGFIDRYLQPVVLISGTAIIVYLFFTVRS
jgi:hypothetical protein